MILYIVQKNDTILSICERFKINPSELISFNKLENYNIKRGDFLHIPRIGKIND